MWKQIFNSIILVVLLSSCSSKQEKQISVAEAIVIPTDTVILTNNNSKFVNGILHIKQKLFSGVAIKYFDSSKQVASVQSFFNGKEQGWLYTYYNNGMKESKRYFKLGEKDSVHTGWWDNGNIRFEYRFENGNYHGLFKEWYQYSGKPLKEIVYENGTDISGKGWRENGKLYMNFVNRDGRRYGLQNAQPCYSIKDGRGSYFSKDSLR